MGRPVATLLVGALFLVAGLYFLVGPLQGNVQANVLTGAPLYYQLPDWFRAWVPLEVEVSWTASASSTTVTVVSCPDAACGPPTEEANGTGTLSSLTFTADPGQLYAVEASDPATVTVSAQQAHGAYGALDFVDFVLALVLIGTALVTYHRDSGAKYRPI